MDKKRMRPPGEFFGNDKDGRLCMSIGAFKYVYIPFEHPNAQKLRELDQGFRMEWLRVMCPDLIVHEED